MGQRSIDGGESAYTITESDIGISIRHERTDERLAIEYAVVSEREAPATVRLVQPLPDEVDSEAIEFPPQRSDRWTLEDGSVLRLDCTVEPDETVRAAWGLEGTPNVTLEEPEFTALDAGEIGGNDQSTGGSTEDGGTGSGNEDDDRDADERPDHEDLSLSTDPDGVVVSPEEGDAGSTGAPDASEEDAGERDATAGQTGGRPDASDEGSPTVGDPGERDDGVPDGRSGGRDDHVGGDGDPAGDDGRAVGIDGGTSRDADRLDADAATDRSNSLAAELARELQSRDLDQSDLATLREALAVSLSSDSEAAYAQHLEAKLEREREQLETLTEDLEESVERLYRVKADTTDVTELKRGLTQIDDKTVSREAYRSLLERHEQLAETAAEASTVEDLAGTIEALDERTPDREAVETLRERHEQLADSAATTEHVADVEADVRADLTELREEHDARLAEADEERSDLEDRLEATSGDVDTLEDRLDETDEELSSLEARLDETDEERSALETRLDETDGEVSDLDDRLLDLNDDVLTLESRLNYTSTDVATLEDELDETDEAVADIDERLEAVYVTDEDVRDVVDEQLQGSARSLGAFGIGVGGIAAAIPLAAVGETTMAILPFLAGVLAMCVWIYDREIQ